MIKSFKDRPTAAVFSGLFVKSLPQDIQRRARAKLRQIDHALTLDDLRIPPSNRLETLEGGRKGQWSIRINRQWRVCFVWRDGDAFDVEITDYH